jgi:hypothetical protein
MKYPEWFEMGPTRWTIKWDENLIKSYRVEHGEDVIGYCDSNKCEIVVSPKLAISRKQETLIHEIGHAACVFIDKDKMSEETFVANAMPFILQALRSSTKLRKFLFDA